MTFQTSWARTSAHAKYSADLGNFAEKWVDREIDEICLKELPLLCKKNKLDPCGETPTPWYHTMVLDSPLFKESIQINKLDRKKYGSNCYMNFKDASLKSKE